MLKVRSSSLLQDFPGNRRGLAVVYSCGTGDRGWTVGIESRRSVGDRVLLAFEVHGGVAVEESYWRVIGDVGRGAWGLGHRLVGGRGGLVGARLGRLLSSVSSLGRRLLNSLSGLERPLSPWGNLWRLLRPWGGGRPGSWSIGGLHTWTALRPLPLGALTWRLRNRS